MTTATKKTKTAPATISAPKIETAWRGVCEVSAKSEADIVASVEKLYAVMTSESRLSTRDIKKVVSEMKGADGKALVSPFVSTSHVPAIPTWHNFRAKFEDFRALPLAKQLSTASASYDLLGAGKGEELPTLEAVMKETATLRKAKQAGKGKETPAKEKKAKDTLADILAYFTALNFTELSESQQDTVAEIHAVIEGAMISA